MPFVLSMASKIAGKSITTQSVIVLNSVAKSKVAKNNEITM
jgi:hypothetical protein